MQLLKLDDRLLLDVKGYAKSCTIRKGIRKQFDLGDMILEGTNSGEQIIVNVYRITFLKMRDVEISQHIIKSEGSWNFNRLFNKLKKFYPDLKLDDSVTAIEWCAGWRENK